MARLPRPSAPMVMGTYAGFVAALAVLPVALLLMSWSFGRTVEVAGERAAVTAQLRLWQPEASDRFRYELIQQLSALIVVEGDAVRVEHGPEKLAALVGTAALDGLCDIPGRPDYRDIGDGRRWALACARSDGRVVYAATAPPVISTTFLLFLIIVLVAVVGLVTALVVLRVLAPLGRVSTALERVGGGERDVRLKPTGLAELDEMVFRVNDMAQAMEQREDAITGRIQTVQRMARMVAHEVRNPLQSLELLTTLMAGEDDPTERRGTALAIRREIQVLDQVVDRMLRRSIGEDLDLHARPARLSRLVQHVVRLHQPGARERGIELEVGDLPSELIPVDRALIGRCIENLVLNALQHAASRVRLHGAFREAWVVLHIDDDGPGVDPSVADRIFEADISLREGGTGLGLALVRAVVDAHGGGIEHDTSPLGGARFTLSLPRVTTLTPLGDEAADPGAPP